MSDLERGKREIEREHLGLFLDAYQLATGETFLEIYDSETPDFIGRIEAGRMVGIEIVQLRSSPNLVGANESRSPIGGERLFSTA
jgi:hypothetical protein